MHLVDKPLIQNREALFQDENIFYYFQTFSFLGGVDIFKKLHKFQEQFQNFRKIRNLKKNIWVFFGI
jgi:hypothetical protein